MTAGPRGTAILVHGGWSNPDDWRWVVAALADHDVAAVAPDLPSHRSPTATLRDDAAAVEAELHAARPPVVLVGWSHGGKVLSEASVPESVVRLVYVAAIPHVAPTDDDPRPETPLDLAHVLFPDDRTCVLDDDWWLTDGDATTLPAPVVAHLWAHRRRPASLAALTQVPAHEPWQTIPTTVLLGRSDATPELQAWAQRRFADVRIVDSDHFVLFRLPGVIADIVVEAIEASTPVLPAT